MQLQAAGIDAGAVNTHRINDYTGSLLPQLSELLVLEYIANESGAGVAVRYITDDRKNSQIEHPSYSRCVLT